MEGLKDKVVLISGTAGGQGRAAALAFAREGAKVFGCDIKVAEAEETVRMVTDALFADTQTVDSNSFVTGTVDISTAPVSALLALNPMAPGDEVNNPITVNNAGNLELRYAIQRLTDNPDAKALRDVLRLRVGLKGGAGCDFPYYTSAGVPIGGRLLVMTQVSGQYARGKIPRTGVWKMKCMSPRGRCQDGGITGQPSVMP